MDLPTDIKPLIEKWLNEEIQLLEKNSSKLVLQYRKALDSVKKSPLPVAHTKDLLSLQFIGPKIVLKFDKKLVKYCQLNGYNVPELESENVDANIEPVKKKRKPSTRKYIPLKRSGGYAIVLSLYMNDYRGGGLTKDEIIKFASSYSDQSFHANPSTNQFYSAWTSSKTLLNRGLIECKGRPQRYFLSDEGENLAKLLLESENLTKPDITTEKYELSNLSIHENHGYSIWEAGSFEIELIIDNREIRSASQRNFFEDKLTTLGVSCHTLALSVGDGVWIAKSRDGKKAVLDFIFERKRLDDLASSIKDGRYLEQKSRLRRTGIGNIFYIVEETMSSDVSMMSDAIQTAILINVIHSQFQVRRTKDSDETVHFLKLLTEKIADLYSDRSLLVIENPQIENQLQYKEILHNFQDKFDTKTMNSVYRFDIFQDLLNKSDLVTVKDLFIKMLMTIKGVSLEKLVMIQRKFPTPKSLITAYAGCDSLKAKELLLLTSSSNELGSKKIGPALSKKIYENWG